jgi:Flp pilus assembly protein TadD
LNRWGYRLLQSGRPKEGLELMPLMAHLHPDSASAHDSFGGAQVTNKDAAPAVPHYQRSVQLDPKNNNAAQPLKTLGDSAATTH